MTSCCENTNPATDAGTGIYGYSHTMGGYDGGQAEYVRVPFIGVDAEQIPDDVEDLDALPITDAFTTGYQAAEMCELKGGETVLVLGCGPVGLFSMWSAWAMGAGRVIAVDHMDYRLEFARQWLGVETLNFRDVDLVSTVKGMTEGRGADATVDAVGCEAAGSPVHRAMGVHLKMEAGSPQAINTAIHATRKAGIISLIGAYGPPYMGVDIGTFMNKAQRMNTGPWQRVADLSGRVFEQQESNRDGGERSRGDDPPGPQLLQVESSHRGHSILRAIRVSRISP
jgi:threonine dehydrogenase-like Zn-dependent dehydrogenase